LRHYGAVVRRGLLRATAEKKIRSASKGAAIAVIHARAVQFSDL
jgi:hypothetical protein